MEKVYLGPYEYNVEFVECPMSKSREEVIGHIDYEKQIILIGNTQSVLVQRQTLMHEIVHALDYQYKLRLDEDGVDCIASGITEALLRNPWIAEFLAVGK